jgi:hypothetical protein
VLVKEVHSGCFAVSIDANAAVSIPEYKRYVLIDEIVERSLMIVLRYRCHAIRLNLEAVNSCSECWADTKILTLSGGHRLTLVPLVHPLALVRSITNASIGSATRSSL